MSLWGLRRQVRIAAVFALFVALPIAALLVFLFWERPTCADGKQNGDERGVDCGGSCASVCSSEVNAPVVDWSRHFMVSPGRYNVIAYVENPNAAAMARDVPYRFRLYDADGAVIAEREGAVTLRPLLSTPIVENGLSTESRSATRVSFEFLSPPSWVAGKPQDPIISVADEQLVDGPEPRVTATVANAALVAVRDLYVVAIVYAADGNAVGASRTLVDQLDPDARQTLTFTWGAPFSTPGASIKVVPLYNDPAAH